MLTSRVCSSLPLVTDPPQKHHGGALQVQQPILKVRLVGSASKCAGSFPLFPVRLQQRGRRERAWAGLVGCSMPLQHSLECTRALRKGCRRRRRRGVATASSSSAATPAFDNEGFEVHPAVKEGLGKLKGSHAPMTSDILWSALGGFVAMAAMGYLDKLLLPKGLSFSLGSFGAVCTLLFAAPKAPVSAKYNVLVSHLFCAMTGVAALAAFGPGWAAKSTALAACIAFMQYTGSIHPPAAGLPLIFIDAPKFHALKWWYILFPGVVGCLFLFMLAEVVEFLKQKFRF